ncbi:MBL fold metallo-hydrolase [Archangium violaceum]|uniref:ComEC/Rec2 family competence protein n=1 Tax=Archangium violaceum TaxID=83451 RepID=UPI001950F6B7|nr:MBL fold metallo-hydrolase [Archangium violaceum]QRN99775.1 MBL fold metallo-hydrolase [Archangium violaceum]
MSRHVRTLAVLLGVLLASACEQQPAPADGQKPSPTLARRYFGRPADGKLHVYFFDVGQGDATLIVSPTGRTVLVDAGPATAGTHLANRLPELLTDKLDLVVLTHPHPDHYSGLAAAVGAVGARKLLEPQLPNTLSNYDALLTSLAGNGVEVFSPSPSSADEPLRLPLGGDTELTVLWPRAPTEPLLVGDSAQELNSIVLRLTYKDTAVLLTGDARERTESHLLERKAPLRATLLKVGAHGDGAASSAPFLDAVHPGAAIISSGVNPRGNPAKAVLDRMVVQKIRVFRTDRDGEVHAISDGQRFTLTTQRHPAGTPAGTSEVFAGLGDSAPATQPALAALKPTSGQVALPAAVTKGKEAEASRTAVAPARSQGNVDISLDDGPTPAPKVVRNERPAPMKRSGKTQYVASRNSKLFHLPECRSAKRIKEKNLISFPNRDEAIAQHYEPARDCKP